MNLQVSTTGRFFSIITVVLGPINPCVAVTVSCLERTTPRSGRFHCTTLVFARIETNRPVRSQAVFIEIALNHLHTRSWGEITGAVLS